MRAWRGLPLRPTLVTVMALLILFGSAGVGLFAYASSSQIVDALWKDFADQQAAATMQRTLRYFEPSEPFVILSRDAALRGQIDVGPFTEDHPPSELLDHLRAGLMAHPEFTWTSFGTRDGTYVAVQRTPEGDLHGHWRTASGEGTEMRVLVRDSEVDGGWRIVETTDGGTYDPRQRPWYRAALETPEVGVWVDPFVFATVGQPGFTYARAHVEGSEVEGVWAVEYEVSALSTFLAGLEVGEEGRVYVVTANGEVVGHPTGQTMQTHGGELVIARAESHADPMLRTAWAAVDGAPSRPQRLQAEGLLIMIQPLPAASGIDWAIFVVVPEADFFGPVRDQARTAVAVSVVATFLAIVCGVLFSSRVSGALRHLAAELERVGQFDLARRDLGRAASFVREVNEMRRIIDRTKASLRSFGKYIPKDVVRDLIVGGEEANLGGRKAELTILFSDIAGFTTVAEQLDPDELVSLLAEYLEGLSDAVRLQQGTVDKYIGDAIMAFWGAPRDDAEHALHACEGALAMQARLRELQAGWSERGLPRLDTRIGLNTGEVLVGNFGAASRLNYTVMGDPVNLASRIEGLNKRYGTSIVLGENTAAQVESHMVLRPLEWVAVKGKTRAVLLHELVGRKSEVPESTLAAIEKYRAALDLYRAKRFDEAAEAFDEAAAAYGDDVASRLMAEQSRAHAVSPPDEAWDGSTAMTTK